MHGAEPGLMENYSLMAHIFPCLGQGTVKKKTSVSFQTNIRKHCPDLLLFFCLSKSRQKEDKTPLERDDLRNILNAKD